jgi:cellulose biosynthesis protein BcsQ
MPAIVTALANQKGGVGKTTVTTDFLSQNFNLRHGQT